MKYIKEEKKGETISSLAQAFNIRESNIKYLIALIEKYGNNILRKDKNKVYSKEFNTISRLNSECLINLNYILFSKELKLLALNIVSIL